MKGFQLDTLAEGMTPAGFLLRHEGVRHRRARRNASRRAGTTSTRAPDLVGEIPLSRLIAPGAVVDVTAQAAEADADYRASAEDIRNWGGGTRRHRAGHGRCSSGPGWAARWPDALSYLGDDEPGRADDLHFPGLAEECDAAPGRAGRGARGHRHTPAWTTALPPTSSCTRSAARAGIPNLENVGDLSEVPRDRIPADRPAHEDRVRYRRPGADRRTDSARLIRDPSDAPQPTVRPAVRTGSR